jgi:hypothetical protein
LLLLSAGALWRRQQTDDSNTRKKQFARHLMPPPINMPETTYVSEYYRVQFSEIQGNIEDSFVEIANV